MVVVISVGRLIESGADVDIQTAEGKRGVELPDTRWADDLSKMASSGGLRVAQLAWSR